MDGIFGGGFGFGGRPGGRMGFPRLRRFLGLSCPPEKLAKVEYPDGRIVVIPQSKHHFRPLTRDTYAAYADIEYPPCDYWVALGVEALFEVGGEKWNARYMRELVKEKCDINIPKEVEFEGMNDHSTSTSTTTSPVQK